MSERKNDIFEEQKKARQEFLELKKMQSGEMEAPPKPSELAVLPKTPKEKLNNFWFQYKWHTIAVVALVVVLSVLISQCATRTKYDIEVVFFTYTPVMDIQIDEVADYIAKHARDVNGDGEINIQVVNCSFNNSGTDNQYRYTMLTKLQALIAGDQNALLYITDDKSYKYLEGISEDSSIFEDEPYKFGEDFYNETKLEKYGDLPKGLQISCRRVSDTVLEGKKGVKQSYEEAINILNSIKK